MISIFFVLSLVVFGLATGSTFALVSLGLSLTYGLMRVLNVAHGLYYALGAFVLYSVVSAIGNFWLGVVVAAAAGAGFGLLSELFLIRPLYGKNFDFTLIVTFAVALIGVDVIKIVWGVYEIPVAPPFNWAFPLGDVTVSIYLILVIAVTMLVYLATHLYINRTYIGKIVKAALEDMEGVQGLGINPRMSLALTFTLGTTVAALAGALFAPLVAVDYNLAFSIILFAFATVVAGGLGSVNGSLFAGLILGEAESLSGLFWPQGSTVIVFIVMALILVIRPQGLRGG